MKRIIYILSILAMICMTTNAQQLLDTTNILDTMNVLDTTNVFDTINAIKPTLITDEMPYAIVHQDSLIKQLMSDKRSGYTRGEQLMDGFRVQIYASNQQQLAKQEATELQQRIEPLIDIPIYTISEPPFWKVRIGNFTTREDANEYKNTFLQLFPELTGSTYIVPDKIIIIR